MGEAGTWGTSPRVSIEREVSTRGHDGFVVGCRSLLRGERVDRELLLALAGPAAQPFLADPDRPDAYWLRVWGARGLLWEWDEAAEAEIAAALSDESWRVREMALKVAARHRIGDVLDGVVACRADSVARVRAAADRAAQIIVGSSA